MTQHDSNNVEKWMEVMFAEPHGSEPFPFLMRGVLQRKIFCRAKIRVLYLIQGRREPCEYIYLSDRAMPSHPNSLYRVTCRSTVAVSRAMHAS
jgi:hypothetical protein